MSSLTVSVRFNETAHNRLLDYCEIAGVKKGELIRCATAFYISQCMPMCDKTQVSSRVRDSLSESINNNMAVCDKTQKRSTDDVQPFFREFWVKVKNQFFPKRVVSVMKKHWDALKEWGGSPSQLAKLYNDYCAAERAKGREFSHPNSWIAGHGWLNDSKAERTLGHAYDVDVDMTGGGL